MCNILAPKRAGQKKVLARKNMQKSRLISKWKKRQKQKCWSSPISNRGPLACEARVIPLHQRIRAESIVRGIDINQIFQNRDKTRFLGQNDVVTSLRRYVIIFFHIKMCAYTRSILPDSLRAIADEPSHWEQIFRDEFPRFSRKTVTFLGNNSGTAWPILDLIFALER